MPLTKHLPMLIHYLIIAIVLEAFTGADANCKWIHGKPFAVYHYSGSPSDEDEYQSGTFVTMSCRESTVVGNNKSQCVNSEWVPKLGECSKSFTCTFGENEKRLGYSGMVYPIGSTTVDGPFTTYFECGDGLDLFSCYIGEWKPVIGSRRMCECPGIDKPNNNTNLRYSQDANVDGRYKRGTQLTVSCTENTNVQKEATEMKSTCTGTGWVPAPEACRPQSACHAIRPKENSTLTYSAPSSHGKYYKSGTHVTVSCKDGSPIIGGRKSQCKDAKWEPDLGRCSLSCPISELKKKHKYRFVEPIPKSNSEWVRHGGKAKGSYGPTLQYIPRIRVYEFTCSDGEWKKVE